MFETAVLPLARSNTPARFDGLARRVRERMHPDSITVRAGLAAAGRGVWIDAEPDGMAVLHVRAKAEDVCAVEQRLHRHAEDLDVEGEPRTVRQLRADVVIDLLLGQAATAGGATIDLMVTVPAVTLAGAAEEPGELVGYGPIDPATARRLAGHAPTLTRVLTRPDSGDVTVSAGKYRIPARLRRRLRLQDERCRFPGCTHPALTSDLDHATAWTDGGTTTPCNLSHLCRWHHMMKHATDWEIALTEGRAVTFTSPLGTRTTTRPPAHDVAAALATVHPPPG